MKDQVRYAVGLDSTVDALVEARTAPLREALQGLVDRLDEVHADKAYQSVWTSYMIHGGRYQGPTYVEALTRARAALNAATTSEGTPGTEGPDQSGRSSAGVNNI